MDKGNKVVQGAGRKSATGAPAALFAVSQVLESHRLQKHPGVGNEAPQVLGPLAHLRDLQATFSNKMQIGNCLTEELGGKNQCKQNLCCHGDH